MGSSSLHGLAGSSKGVQSSKFWSLVEAKSHYEKDKFEHDEETIEDNEGLEDNERLRGENEQLKKKHGEKL